MLRLGELVFDPVLHNGYSDIQALEPDLLSAQSDILWATHLVFVFPIWWGGIPALMKGFLDRIFLPGFAFKYRAGKTFPDKLLQGRTAHLLVTLDTPPVVLPLGLSHAGHSPDACDYAGVLRHQANQDLDVRAGPGVYTGAAGEVAEAGRRTI